MRARFQFTIVCTLAIATAATAADAPATKSPWEGFGVGSWVQRKKATKMSVPGMPMPDDGAEVRETLVGVTDDAHTVKQEKKTPTGWEVTDEVTYPRHDVKPASDDGSSPKVEDLGKEKLTVEKQTFDCKKTRTTWGDTTTTAWTSATNGVLKTIVESGAGGGSTTDTRTVTSFAKKVSLMGKDLVCRETTLFTKMERPGVPSGGPGDGTSGTELECDAVPGHRVRIDLTSKRGPVSMTSLVEVVAFEAKRP